MRVFRRAESQTLYMLLINDREEVEGQREGGREGRGRATTDNQHKYPGTVSEGNAAAGGRLSALYSDKWQLSSLEVVLFAVILLSPQPLSSSNVDYSPRNSLIINQTGDIISRNIQAQSRGQTV